MRAGLLLAGWGGCVLMGAPSWAALDYSSIGATYSQDFDSLAMSGTGITWINDATISGWHLFRRTSSSNATPVAITSYATDDGTATKGGFYSFGSAGSSERALGSLGSANLGDFGGAGILSTGVVIGWMAVSFTNNTGSVLPQFTVAYDGEQWRDGAPDPAEPQTMGFEYGFGSSFESVSIWTAPGGTFEFTSPVVTTTAGKVDGNTSGRDADLGGTIADLTWADGDTLWLRWTELNDWSFDHALAIDNFSFSAGAITAVPEPSAFLFGGILCCALGVVAAIRAAIGVAKHAPQSTVEAQGPG